MTPAAIEAVLEKHKGTFPVPVIAIANDLGKEVYKINDFEDTESGSLRKEDGKFVIYVNAKHTSTRKRFTIAHEIGLLSKIKITLRARRNVSTAYGRLICSP